MAAFGAPPPNGQTRSFPGIPSECSPVDTQKVWEDSLKKEKLGRGTFQLLEAYGKLGLDKAWATDDTRRCDLVAGFASVANAYDRLGWKVLDNGRTVQPDAYAILGPLSMTHKTAGASQCGTVSQISGSQPSTSVLSKSSLQLTALTANAQGLPEGQRSNVQSEVASKAPPSSCWEFQPREFEGGHPDRNSAPAMQWAFHESRLALRESERPPSIIRGCAYMRPPTRMRLERTSSSRQGPRQPVDASLQDRPASATPGTRRQVASLPAALQRAKSQQLQAADRSVPKPSWQATLRQGNRDVDASVRPSAGFSRQRRAVAAAM